MTFEDTILVKLTTSEEYSRKVLPFLNEEYFTSEGAKLVFNLINDYVTTYNELPSRDELKIELDGRSKITQGEFEGATQVLKNLEIEPQVHTTQWMLDQTEKFCKDRAMYNAVVKSISIIDGKEKDLTADAIPDIVQQALAVSFDTDIGHDYVDDAMARYEYYNAVVSRLPFSLDMMNRITKGGVPPKTLNVLMAGVNVGKSLTMCSFAADNLRDQKNVLYITMELSEEEVARRIDANLLDTDIGQLESLSRTVYEQKINHLRDTMNIGKLKIKEYPTAGASAANFRHLLKELEHKQKFKPDVIYIDYLNICASARLKGAAAANMYNYVKAIAEELRGLAVEFAVPIWTATQVNREGYTNSDFGMEHQSESFGLPATADLMLALIAPEELVENGQMMVKQLKSRYADPNLYKRFLVNVDKTRMRVFDSNNPTEGLIGHKDEEDAPPKIKMFEELK